MKIREEEDMQIGIRLHDTKRDIGRTLCDRRGTGIFLCASCFEKVISEYSVADSALTPGFSCYLKKLFARIIWMLRYWDVI